MRTINLFLFFLFFPFLISYSITFTADNITLYSDEKPYVKTIVKGLNKLAKENPKCRRNIYWGGLSKSKTKQNGYPTFFATCNNSTVYFSEKDLAENSNVKEVSHLSKKKAVKLCADVPEDFEAWEKHHSKYKRKLWKYGEWKNGRTFVAVRMQKKGYDQKYHISCLLDEKGLIEAVMTGGDYNPNDLRDCDVCLRKKYR
ncbi:MAG: hypothetical protein HOJ77_07210 [Flavobacteriales bacterium]|jgi:hypothetical protein|nr:hypothetical protein [Flavobacteriales bacterium]